MRPVESLRLSWRSIRGHKLRSALTTLGVVIGVAAVITFVTLGASLQADIVGGVSTDTSRTMEVDLAPTEREGPPQANNQPVFSARDVEQLRGIEGVEAVVPTGGVATAAVGRGNRTVAVQGIVATTPARFRTDDDASDEFEAGRPFRLGADELVVNDAAAGQFPRNLSVGDEVRVVLAGGRTRNVTVVGVLNASSDVNPFGGAAPPRYYVPVDPFYETTVESPTTGEQVRVYPSLTVVADAPEAVPEVQRRVERYLANRSDARELVPEGVEFRVRTAQEQVEQIREFISTFTGYITGIAVISLVVGAIGIANIMLVSVTERTREIGIMKAVGARNRDVLQLFLVEAVLLGVAGALLGTAVGLATGYGAAVYLELDPTFRPTWVPIAVAVGVGVGVVAGLYPAWNAARTDPIEALRYE